MKISYFLIISLLWKSVHSGEYLLASFNVRVFGQKKIQNQPVVDHLIEIISRYDLILIQEIRDASETAIEELIKQVNEANDNAFAMVTSPRLGRTSSKEQYSVFYRHEFFQPVDSYVYSDPDDVFEREPFNVRFQVSNWALPDLVISAIHTKPDDAVSELSHMVDVYEDLVVRWSIQNVLIMGDFNADCNYVRKKNWPDVRLRNDSRFQWYIDDEDDTTVRESTDCAYDRFAVAGEDLQAAVKTASVFNFAEEFHINMSVAEMVSDHFPIQMRISAQDFQTPAPKHYGNGSSRETSSTKIFRLLGILFECLVLGDCL